ncbi:aldo/keto reductase [Candidatus Woesearchaeota archaeon CG10_big_fil_rev_8_21_14_0_10_32_9]|nr:MAG: aldo/keto reductase [Candidatus Woesearchaeota archaeon CG10_big_fil_rev_8_21_14_0_10_32_9]
MEFKLLDKDFKIPVLGLGTWGMGGFMETDSSSDEESIRAIKDAINIGYTHIDTAEVYGAGHTEELIGKAIKDLDRSKLIITSKVFKTNLKYDDVITSCKKSLEKLQTNYIDLYLIHAPNPKISLEETMKAMDYLIEQKLVRFIGVSNFSVNEMKEAQRYSKNKIIANQIPYNLATRNNDYKGNCTNMESEIIPYCQENDIIIIACRPIERGLLLEPNPVLDELSKKYNKTKAQIAINWLISKKGIITIPKSTNIEHLKENLCSVGWNLSIEDIKLLDETKFENPSS